MLPAVADGLTLPNAAPAGGGDLAQVSVERLVTIAMVDHHRIAITTGRPAGEDHHTAVSSIDRRAFARGDIDA